MTLINVIWDQVTEFKQTLEENRRNVTVGTFVSHPEFNLLTVQEEELPLTSVAKSIK